MTTQKTSIEGSRPTALELYTSLTNYSLSNRHKDFQIYEEGTEDEGGLQSLKDDVLRGFLATRWLKKTDLDNGFLMADTDCYPMHCSERLSASLVDCRPDSYMTAIRAICSFQMLTDGTKRVICHVFYKTPFIKD